MLGLFLFLSPWFLGYSQSLSKADASVSRLVVVLISIADIPVFSEWQEWLNLLLGLWLIFAPWTLGVAHTAARFSIGVGLTIAYITLLDIWWIRYGTNTTPIDP
jgi:hypothetical protein